MGFQCRQFYLKDDQCAMKVSTDSFLLGAWVPLLADRSGPQRVLDIGTGCGILALMLAQRLAPPASGSAPSNGQHGIHIDAVELDPASAAQAQENINASPWSAQIRVHQQDIIAWTAASASGNYDLVISNPPYFSLPMGGSNAAAQHEIHGSANDPRGVARHQHRLDFQQLFSLGAQQLAVAGTLAVVLPRSAWESATEQAAAAGLTLTHCCWVQSKATGPVKLVLALFRRTGRANAAPVSETRLVIHAETANKKGTGLAYSDAFKDLLQDFYLGTNW